MNPSLSKIAVGLGCDINRSDTGGSFDLDGSAFLFNNSGKVSKLGDFIFYGNMKHFSGGVEHMGNNFAKENGDNEQIKINLMNVLAKVNKIAFTFTIYDAEKRKQNFGQVSNVFIRIFHEENGKEILRYDLNEDFSIETAIVLGELYKNGGEWKFNAIGGGLQGGLAALRVNYGIDIENDRGRKNGR